MMRSLALLLSSLVLVLAGCGDPGDDVAQDPAPPSTPTSTATPTAEPTVGTYPEFEPQNYTYTLVVSCFCPDGGVPVEITVEDGEVTSAVYGQDGRGVRKGDPAEDYRQITINDVIEAANDTEAHSVDVDWPEGQDYPSSVAVDPDELTIDEEVAYTISEVVVA